MTKWSLDTRWSQEQVLLVFHCCCCVQVNIDYQTSKDIMENMKTPSRTTFSRAQQSIYLLMARDSFVRFVKSEHFQQALKRLKR